MRRWRLGRMSRDAVVAARRPWGKWSGATAYNRGQVLYRVAEMIEGRAGQFAEEVIQAEGVSAGVRGGRSLTRLTGGSGLRAGRTRSRRSPAAANQVAGPYFNFSVPEPTGVVAVLAPPDSSLLGLVSVIAPVIATGNTAVVVASETRPLPAHHALGGARHLGRARRRRQCADRPDGRTRTRARRSLRCERDRPHRCRCLEPGRAGAACGGQRQAGVLPGRGLGRGADAEADAGVPRDEDGLAPRRNLTRLGAGRVGGPTDGRSGKYRRDNEIRCFRRDACPARRSVPRLGHHRAVARRA